MAFFDLPLSALRDYRPDVDEPADFDAFWSQTLAETDEYPLDLRHPVHPAGLRHVEVHDVTFAGFGGHPIKAWYLRPAGTPEELPLVIQYVGYSGGRGLAHEHTLLPAAGYAHLVMDTRGQGYSGSGGHTPDPGGTVPSVPGFVTRGIADPHEYYYRRLFTDAARAVQAGAALPGVDAGRIAVTGGSQGGAIAIAAAALAPTVAATIAHVPFLQHPRRAIAITNAAPFVEITKYLAVHRHDADTLWRTLSYVDGVNLAKRATAPALYSAGLMDLTCPPSTVFASFNAYGEAAAAPVDKSIEVWEYNGHEGGGGHQRELDLRWLSETLRP